MLIADVERPAAANEDSTALLTWLTSALSAAAGEVDATRAVMTLALPDPELPVWTEAVADGPTLAPIPTIAELRLLGTSVDNTSRTAVESNT